ncbi:radical SAM (seleno)protein TrsS [Desulforhopalus sp. 52FAK]
MAEFIQNVESVCPECLQRLTGHLVQSGDKIVLEKSCFEHGSFSTTVWKGEPFFDSWYRPKFPYFGGERRQTGKGCPYDCGLCEHHTQRTCTALVEITSRCNLQCPVCFADAGGTELDVDLETLAQMFESIVAQTGGCNLQLSGGEPTVRKDLALIVRMAREAGIDFVQLNTNGLALARDPELATELKEAGLSSVFLQFDGVDDDVFFPLRGQPLFEVKCQAIEHLSAADIGIVLVPTVVRGVNDHQLWDIVRFGLERQPHVRGVHFQPISYFGRFPEEFTPDHVTLPEIMTGVAQQSGSTIHAEDFRPPGCEHALCSFSAKYLMREDGELMKLGSDSCDCKPKPAEEGALTSIGVTARQWGSAPVLSDNAEQPMDDLSKFLQRARTHIFSISGMAFQDCWSLNLDRLQGCCIHVAQPGGKLIPFCSFNLTARNGRPLHRPTGQQTSLVA